MHVSMLSSFMVQLLKPGLSLYEIHFLLIKHAFHMNPLCRNQAQISIPSVVHSWIHPLWENCSPKSNSKYSPALPCPLVSTFPWRSPFIVFSFYDLALGLILYSLNIYLLLNQILRKSTVNVIKF